VSAGGFIILVAQDDTNQVHSLQRAFSKVGSPKLADLKGCKDGEEAIAYLAGDGEYGDRSMYPLPSLVLLDLKLPGKSGMDVLAWIRRDPHVRSTPVIILSSSEEPADLERAYALGVNGYLVKPLEFDGLLEMARGILSFWVELNELPPRLSSTLPSPDR
jgi:CheY-like chemotaxis protein